MFNNKPKMPHEGHDQHLCYLVNMRYHETNLEDYAEIVRESQYVCKNCGRTAHDKSRLCRPVKL